MKRLITATLLPAILMLPTLLSATPLPVNLGDPFTLGPGQSAEVIDGELYLAFTGILGDSRCPVGVWCWWEGDAAAAVVGDLPGEIQIDCVLHTFWQYDRFCTMGSYEVHLLGVHPYPVYGDPPINPADYLATMVIVEPAPVDVQHEAWGTIKALYR
jgi:hypothetical protein